MPLERLRRHDLADRERRRHDGEMAERLRQAVVAQGLRHGGRRDGRSVVSISLGLASCLPQPGDAADLLEAADQALYRDKDAGRDAVAAAPMAAD